MARTFSYQTRSRLNARKTTATARRRSGAEAGTLTGRSRQLQAEQRPAGRHAAAGAARSALLDALLANKPGPIEIKTVEMLRFHKPIVERFAAPAAEDGDRPHPLPKDLKTSDKDFAKGRVFALRRRRRRVQRVAATSSGCCTNRARSCAG